MNTSEDERWICFICPDAHVVIAASPDNDKIHNIRKSIEDIYGHCVNHIILEKWKARAVLSGNVPGYYLGDIEGLYETIPDDHITTGRKYRCDLIVAKK